jgi:hypothetical protein
MDDVRWPVEFHDRAVTSGFTYFPEIPGDSWSMLGWSTESVEPLILGHQLPRLFNEYFHRVFSPWFPGRFQSARQNALRLPLSLESLRLKRAHRIGSESSSLQKRIVTVVVGGSPNLGAFDKEISATGVP